MEKRYIIALVLIFVILVGYSLIMGYIRGEEPKVEEKEELAEEEVVLEKEGEEVVVEEGEREEPLQVEVEEIVVEPVEVEEPQPVAEEEVEIVEPVEKKEIPVSVVVGEILDLTLVNGEIVEYHFTKYEKRDPEDKQPLITNEVKAPPLTIEFESAVLQRIAGYGFVPDKKRIVVGEDKDETLTLVAEDPSDPERKLIERITFHGQSYMLDVEVEAVGLEEELEKGFRVWAGNFYDPEDEWNHKNVKVLTKVGDEKEKDELGKDSGEIAHEGAINWTALNSKYFGTIIVPQPGDCKGAYIYRSKNELLGVVAQLEEGKPFRLYFGPLEYDRLKGYELSLEWNVDMGWSWIAPISRVFLKLMEWSNRVTGNYGVDIVILSVLLKVLLLPLTQRALRSSKSMQMLQPKIAELKEKLKGEPEKLNKETFALYKKYKINPLGGCLPLLLQMPIFIALFNALRNAVELYGAKFTLWITDLSQADALFRLPFTIPLLNTDKFSLLPILMIVAMVVQNRLTTQGKGGKKDEQQKMMAFLPIIFGFIFYTMPSGLVLYWLINTVLTILQQHYMVKPVEALKEEP